MNKTVDQNNPDIIEDKIICGYCVKRKAELKETGLFLYELEHTATGAKHIHISNNDKENTFSVAFKTVPVDSTGVAHILEHTVLCGSNKFPVRDPFFSMLKRSLSTFMNAFTASDWTMYPFSTQNKKDFYNLMDVYLDAAFFPNINELSFEQEGRRIEIEDDSRSSDSSSPDHFKLVYKGVVYNEMKGAMSSPDQVMARSLLNAMYPDTTYRHNSGGDPAVIPDLTHDQLIEFHKRHYHPSNAFFYTYGNFPLKNHLSFIHEKILKHFKSINPGTDVPSQPRWNKPGKARYSYPLGKNEDTSKKCQVCVAWMTADIKKTFEVLTLALLTQILLGNSASPLRKALIDSGLGTDLCDTTGFDSDNRDTMFVAGLKDVEESAAEKIEAIIFDVLKNLSENGIDKKLIESAIHQLEFHRKEVTNHPYPYGIKLLLDFSGTWFHGGDPKRILQFDADLERLDKALSKEPFFENQIKKYFLNNPHRLLFKLVPDQMMEENEICRVAAELDRIKARITEADLEKIKENAKNLKLLQEEKEDVSSLPTLELEDIPPLVQSVHETDAYNTAPAVCYSQPTSGIFYFSAAAGTGTLRRRLIPLVPFFCHTINKIGTTLHDYTEIAQLIDAYTGGIGLSAHARTSFEERGHCIPFVSFNGKCLVRNQGKMFEIIEELLCKIDFSDFARLKNLFLEYRAGMESMIIHNGHRLAISLASRNFSPSCALSETWHGIHQFKIIKDITNNLTKDKLKSISDDLLSIGKNLFASNNFKIALIGEDQALSTASPYIASIQKGLFHSPLKVDRGCALANGFVFPKVDIGININDEITREGWSTSSAVSFVAQTFETVRMEHEDAPALSVISKLLKSLYLHREIREKGGAYGGFATYNQEDGLFCFGSYRDPHIVSTLKTYNGACSFIRSGDYTEEDIKEAILQICSEIDKPDTPVATAIKSFYRKIIALTDEARNNFKSKLLTLTRNQIMKVAKKYFDQNGKKEAIAVISNEEKLKEANRKLSGSPLNLYRI